MRIVADPGADYRALFGNAYDRCALGYARQRSPTPGTELGLITEDLEPGSI